MKILIYAMSWYLAGILFLFLCDWYKNRIYLYKTKEKAIMLTILVTWPFWTAAIIVLSIFVAIWWILDTFYRYAIEV